MKLIEQAITEYENAGGVVFKKPASGPNAIDAFAASVEITLPDDFREFYSTYECIAYGPEELLSIDQFSEHYALIQDDIRNIKANYLPIIEDGASGYFLIGCQKNGKPKNSEFGAVLHVPGRAPFDIELRGSDFCTFLCGRFRFWKDEI